MLNLLLLGTCLTSLVLANPAGREVTYHVAHHFSNVSALPTFELPATCKSPKDAGSGTQELERWYYDNTFHSCEKFKYKGEDGNDNRFSSEADCLVFCAENPCPSGSYSATGGRRQSCTLDPMTRRDDCPANAFCMIPLRVCCFKEPSVLDFCSQPKDEGRKDVHHAILPVHLWFFNAETNTCEPFQFDGLGGNQNRFVDKKSCSNACKLPTVCPDNRRPLATALGPIVCTADAECPTSNFVCRNGACCPEPRALPVDFDGPLTPKVNAATVDRFSGLVVSALLVLAVYF